MKTSADIIRDFGRDWEIKEEQINELKSMVKITDEEIDVINKFIDKLLSDRFHLESEKIEILKRNNELADEVETLKNLLKEANER
jgi:DNA anti-recombination protein RmuC